MHRPSGPLPIPVVRSLVLHPDLLPHTLRYVYGSFLVISSLPFVRATCFRGFAAFSRSLDARLALAGFRVLSSRSWPRTLVRTHILVASLSIDWFSLPTYTRVLSPHIYLALVRSSSLVFVSFRALHLALGISIVARSYSYRPTHTHTLSLSPPHSLTHSLTLTTRLPSCTHRPDSRTLHRPTPTPPGRRLSDLSPPSLF